MSFRPFAPFIWLAALVLLIGLACNVGSSAAPTPTLAPTTAPTNTPPPPPTNTVPAPTNTSQPEATATDQPPAPRPTQPPQAQAPFELDSRTTAYANGLYEVAIPLGWEIEEEEGAVSFEDPAGIGFIYLQATATGYELDGEAFEWFVIAREQNFFSTYDAYEETEREVDVETGNAYATKSLVFNNIPTTVVTFYNQRGNTIFALDFWADDDVFDAYFAVYSTFIDNITYNLSEADNLLPYAWVYEFYGPNDLFSIEVPTSWYYEYSEGDFSLTETFYSPDDHAIIQNIAYDDGETISKSLAGAFALELLRSSYATDIVITDDEVQSDGSERLIWYSPSGEYTGISFFESRGTTFLLFTIMWDDAFEDIYYDALDYTVSTYYVP